MEFQDWQVIKHFKKNTKTFSYIVHIQRLILAQYLIWDVSHYKK